jgi:coenzyme Q-binding protein COQ10
MTVFHDRAHLPYTPQQVFDLVAGIERYPDFLPWCVGARILRRENNIVYADLVIGWKILRERFSSKVVLTEPSAIHFDYANGPLKYLHGEWRFTPDPRGGTLVEFKVDFEFKSRALALVMGGVFSELVHRMVGAFEARARQLYGASSARLSEPRQPFQQKA